MDRRTARIPAVGSMALILALWSGCTASSGGGGAGGANGGGPDPAGGDAASAELVEGFFNDPDVRTLAHFAGDGLVGKRSLIAAMYPEVQELIDGGSNVAASMLAKFAGTPGRGDEDHLVLFAYALEQMNYADGLDELVGFLERNITGEVPTAVQAVTHAVRQLAGLPLEPTAAYAGSEIEATIVAAGGTLSESRRAKAERRSCFRQYRFTLTEASGVSVTYPSDHPDPAKRDQPIIFSGNVFPADRPLTSDPADAPAEATRIREIVTAGGGHYEDYTDPESGEIYQGEPNEQFNCGGFVFRSFNGHRKWKLDPSAMFSALQSNALIEFVANDADARPGDMVFYYAEGAGLPGHVAEVLNTDDGVRVINADGNSGLFTADADAEYFLGSWLPWAGDARYAKRQIWRWTGPKPTPEVSTDITRGNSCHGCDLDGDGFPDTDNCDDCADSSDGAGGVPAGECINPEFTSAEPEPEPSPEPEREYPWVYEGTATREVFIEWEFFGGGSASDVQSLDVQIRLWGSGSVEGFIGSTPGDFIGHQSTSHEFEYTCPADNAQAGETHTIIQLTFGYAWNGDWEPDGSYEMQTSYYYEQAALSGTYTDTQIFGSASYPERTFTREAPSAPCGISETPVHVWVELTLEDVRFVSSGAD